MLLEEAPAIPLIVGEPFTVLFDLTGRFAGALINILHGAQIGADHVVIIMQRKRLRGCHNIDASYRRDGVRGLLTCRGR